MLFGNGTLSQLEAKRNRTKDKILYWSVIHPRRFGGRPLAAQRVFQDAVREARNLGFPLKNCFLCKYHGRNFHDPTESDPTYGQFEIVLSSGGGSGSGTVEVGWEIDWGASTASQDDISSMGNQSVTLGNGTTSAWVSITAADDTEPEPTESLVVKLTQGAGYTIGNGTQTLSVFDDDSYTSGSGGGSSSGSGSGNQAPIAVDDYVTTAEDTPIQIDMLGNDTDADGRADDTRR